MDSWVVQTLPSILAGGIDFVAGASVRVASISGGSCTLKLVLGSSVKSVENVFLLGTFTSATGVFIPITMSLFATDILGALSTFSILWECSVGASGAVVVYNVFLVPGST
jgi:hypothetical protein